MIYNINKSYAKQKKCNSNLLKAKPMKSFVYILLCILTFNYVPYLVTRINSADYLVSKSFFSDVIKSVKSLHIELKKCSIYLITQEIRYLSINRFSV